MLVVPQIVETVWGEFNKKYFEKLGYKFTNLKDHFKVNVLDLPKHSIINVAVKCDYCGKLFKKKYANYNIEINKEPLFNCACKECSSIKVREINKIKRDTEVILNRTCSSCKNIYPLSSDYFSKCGKDKFGKQMYRYSCKQCDNRIGKIKRQNRKVKIVFIKAKEIYDDHLLREFPSNFWSQLDNNVTKQMLDYIFITKTDSLKLKFNNINTEFIGKYHLRYFLKKYQNLYLFIDYFYPNIYLPWKARKCPSGFWMIKEYQDKAFNWLIRQLFKDKLINNINDLPSTLTNKLLKSYGLHGLSKKYNYSILKLVDNYYPGKFKKIDFNLSHYSQDDKKEMIKQFINDLIKDKVIKNINEIPSVLDVNLFDRYNLKGFLCIYFKGSPFRAINFIYPDHWKQWEFNKVPIGFWNKNENVKQALQWFLNQLIKDGIITNYIDIENIPINRLIDEYKLTTLLNRFHYDLSPCFVKLFPSYFPKDFSYTYRANDGTKMLSDGELLIHNFFLSRGISPSYNASTDKNGKSWYNEQYCESYRPDWIIDNKIIIEYFGYWNPTSKHIRFVNYRKKTQRKINYYKNIDNVIFIPLFPKDLIHGLKGVQNKLNKFINNDFSKAE
jgi:hypothetical protein